MSYYEQLQVRSRRNYPRKSSASWILDLEEVLSENNRLKSRPKFHAPPPPDSAPPMHLLFSRYEQNGGKFQDYDEFIKWVHRVTDQLL